MNREKGIVKVFKVNEITVLVTSAILALTCTKKNEIQNQMVNAIRKSCKASPCLIYMSDIVSFDWEKMYVFHEGASLREIENALGFNYEGEFDLVSLLIFTVGDKIVRCEKYYYTPEKGHKIRFVYSNKNPHVIVCKKEKCCFDVKKIHLERDTVYELTKVN